MNYITKFKLDGKIAIILGGTGLIGREISVAFCEAGARTIILDLNEKKGEALQNKLVKNGHFCEFINCDLTEISQTRDILVKINKKYGRIDAAVNTFYPRTEDWGNNVEKVTSESWSKNVDMHMNAYCMISKYLADIMKANGTGGSIINIGSIYGLVGPDFGVYDNTTITNPPAYSAIKAGIINFTRYVASYYGKYSIRANSICPGGIFDNQDKEFVKNYIKRTPLGRMGNPGDIATTCVFIASDAASYITGATIMVDGGWTCI